MSLDLRVIHTYKIMGYDMGKLRVFNIYDWDDGTETTYAMADKGKVIEAKEQCWRCGLGLRKCEEELGYCRVCVNREYLRIIFSGVLDKVANVVYTCSR